MALNDNIAANSALEGISEQGQEVAEATGNAYTDLGNTEVPDYAEYDAATTADRIDSTASNTSGLDYVDEDKSTVSGQLSNLLSEDSSYITQARLSGEKQAAGRGMLNSSLSAGASQASAIKAALPIAQQDASTYATAQQQQQAGDIAQNATQTEGIVSGALSEQNAEIAGANQRIQNQFAAAMQGANEANSVYLQDMQNQHTTFLTELEADHQLLMQRENTTAAQDQLITTQSSAIMQNYQISVENLMTDPDFLDLGTDAVNNTLNNMQTLAKNSLKFIGASASIDGMDAIVDEYLKDITIQG